MVFINDILYSKFAKFSSGEPGVLQADEGIWNLTLPV